MATKTRGTVKGPKYRDGRKVRRGTGTSKQAKANLIRRVVRPRGKARGR